MNRNIKHLIVGSMLLNVLFVGMLFGQWLKPCGKPGFPPAHIAAALEKLPDEREAEFKATMDKMRENDKGLRDEMKQVREKLVKIIGADKFDTEAYQKESRRLQVLRSQFHQRFADRIESFAKSWPKEDRVILAEMMRRPPRGGPGEDGPSRGGPPPNGPGGPAGPPPGDAPPGGEPPPPPE